MSPQPALSSRPVRSPHDTTGRGVEGVHTDAAVNGPLPPAQGSACCLCAHPPRPSPVPRQRLKPTGLAEALSPSDTCSRLRGAFPSLEEAESSFPLRGFQELAALPAEPSLTPLGSALPLRFSSRSLASTNRHTSQENCRT